MSITIRKASMQDSEKLLSMIIDLADFQGQRDAVKTKNEDLRRYLSSDRPPFECVLAESHGNVVGFALFFTTFSTWSGHPGIYLEDLYVIPEKRGTGIGKQLVAELARIALERGYKRLEFISLMSNRSSYNFNQSLGAKTQSEWLRWRLTEADLCRLTDSNNLNFSASNPLQTYQSV